jgi:hypothetical protein
MSQSQALTRASGGVDQLARPLYFGQDIGVSHRAGFDEIHAEAQQTFQRLAEAEELLQRRQMGFQPKLDQKVCVTSGGIEVRASRRGAKDLQARDREAAAERAKAGKMRCDLVVHGPWSLCSDPSSAVDAAPETTGYAMSQRHPRIW